MGHGPGWGEEGLPVQGEGGLCGGLEAVSG